MHYAAEKTGISVLDIGCGCGYLLSKLLAVQSVSSLFGVDFSIGRLRLAKKRGISNIGACDAERLPFRSNSFDFVLSTETLEHLIDPQGMLQETKRVLKHDGILILTVPSLHTKYMSINFGIISHAVLSIRNPAFLPKDSGLLKPYGQKTCDLYDPSRHDVVVHRAFSTKQLATMLERSFNILELETIMFHPIAGRINPKLATAEQSVMSRLPIVKDLGLTLFAVCQNSKNQPNRY
jgi:SAM-dependent methyltransferase